MLVKVVLPITRFQKNRGTCPTNIVDLQPYRSSTMSINMESGFTPSAFGAWARSPGGEAPEPPSNSRCAGLFFSPSSSLERDRSPGAKKKRPDGGAVARWSWRKKRFLNLVTLYLDNQHFRTECFSVGLRFSLQHLSAEGFSDAAQIFTLMRR